MRLFHVSEEENIKEFRPRILERRKDIDQGKGLVWAVTEERLYNFLFPRECPRVTTFKKIEDKEVVTIGVEKKWLEDIKNCTLYVYEFDDVNFELNDETAGYYVSKYIEKPIKKSIINDCLKEIEDRNISLKVLDNLWEMRDDIFKRSNNFSFCKMNNALPRLEYMGDKKFWDDKFTSRTLKPLKPEVSLIKHIDKLKAGSVLDIACGDGRNTLFLLENDFEVEGVDFSRAALDRLEHFADEKGYDVLTNQIDFSKSKSFNDLDLYDNIIISHYRLRHYQIGKLISHLNDNGVIFITGFSEKHKCDDKIKAKDIIRKDDFKSLEKDFELEVYEETKDPRGCFSTYLFRKVN